MENKRLAKDSPTMLCFMDLFKIRAHHPAIFQKEQIGKTSPNVSKVIR